VTASLWDVVVLVSKWSNHQAGRSIDEMVQLPSAVGSGSLSE
jgi:hypothetical protein